MTLPAVARSGNLRATVIETLQSAIFQGRLRPGAPLRALNLSKELGVSQATVREALLHLAHQGLVTDDPDFGMLVTRLDRQDLRERVEMRMLLEGRTAVRAAPAIREEELKELKRICAEIEDRANRNQDYGAVELDLEFHRYVWTKSGDRTAYRVLDQLTAPLLAFISVVRREHAEQLRDSLILGENHRTLIEALRNGDPERIRIAFERHAEVSYRRFYDFNYHLAE